MTAKNLVKLIIKRGGLKHRLTKNWFLRNYSQADYDLLEYLLRLSQAEDTMYDMVDMFWLMVTIRKGEGNI